MGNAMRWYLTALKNYAKFDGRARRKEFWYFSLFYVVFTFPVALIDALLPVALALPVSLTFALALLGTGILEVIYHLVHLVPAIAVGVRRLHDIGRSGYWILINGWVWVRLTPRTLEDEGGWPYLVVQFFVGGILGGFILLWFWVKDSELGDNRYGPNPKGEIPASAPAAG